MEEETFLERRAAEAEEEVGEELGDIKEDVLRLLNGFDKRKVLFVFLVILLAIGLRAGWEYQARHDVENQCAALHLFVEDSDGTLHTTDVAASSKFTVLEADRALKQLRSEEVFRTLDISRIYPGYSIKISDAEVQERCRNIEWRDELRSREDWRIS